MKAVKAEDLAVGKTVYLTGGKKIRGTKKVDGVDAPPDIPPPGDKPPSHKPPAGAGKKDKDK